MTDYNKLGAVKKEDYLEIEIIKYLQYIKQPVTITQIMGYLVDNVKDIPDDVLTKVISKRTTIFTFQKTC